MHRGATSLIIADEWLSQTASNCRHVEMRATVWEKSSQQAKIPTVMSACKDKRPVILAARETERNEEGAVRTAFHGLVRRGGRKISLSSCRGNFKRDRSKPPSAGGMC
jgi:hypothetical protein